MREINTAVATVDVRTAIQKFPAGTTVTRADLGERFDALLACSAISIDREHKISGDELIKVILSRVDDGLTTSKIAGKNTKLRPKPSKK